MIEYIGDMPISRESKRILDATLSKEEHIHFVRWLREHVNIPDYATLLIDSEYCRGAIAGWRGAVEYRHQVKDREANASEAYDAIDSFLRNSLDDNDYALYSKALDDIFSRRGEPVGRIKTVGGYPDGSEHTVEWLVKHKDIQDGDLLYTSPQPAEPVGWKSDGCNCNQGQVCQVCDPIVEPVKVPSDDDLIDLASQHSLVFRTHHGDVLTPWKEDVDIGEYLISYSRALLDHYGHPTTPEDWQLVPKEPTEEMLEGVRQFFSFDDTAEVVYKNMLKTAPKFGEGE